MVGGPQKLVRVKSSGANIIATSTKHAFPVSYSYKGLWGHARGKF